MSKKYLILFTALFIFSSCIVQKPIRRLKEVNDAAIGMQLSEIDRLIEATTVENRDIKSAAVYYLTRYIPYLQHKKLTRSFTKEIRTEQLNRLQDHLIKIFSIQNDFNIRCLCLQGLSRMQNTKTFELIIEAVNDSDDSVKGTAVKNMFLYLDSEEFRTNQVKQKLLQMLKSEHPPILFNVIKNLSCFSSDQDVIKSLNNFCEINNDPAILQFVKDNVKGVKVEI